MFERRVIIEDSSNVSMLLYDIDGKILEVEFHDGSAYQYKPVSLTQFGTLVGATSVGSAFNTLRKASNWATTKLV